MSRNVLVTIALILGTVIIITTAVTISANYMANHFFRRSPWMGCHFMEIGEHMMTYERPRSEDNITVSVNKISIKGIVTEVIHHKFEIISVEDNVTYDVMVMNDWLIVFPNGSLVELHSYEFVALYLVKGSEVVVKGYIVDACRICEFMGMHVEEHENKVLATEVYLVDLGIKATSLETI